MINREIGQRFEASLAGSSQKLEQKEESNDCSFGDTLAEKETKADKEEKKEMAELEIERTESQSEVNKREHEKFLERQNVLISTNNLASSQQMANNMPMMRNPVNTPDMKHAARGNQIANQGEVGLKDLQKLMAQRGITFAQLDQQQLGKLSTTHSKTEVNNFLNQLAKKLRYDDKNELAAGPELSGDKKEIKGEKVKETGKKEQLGDRKEELEAAAENMDKKQGVPLSQFFDQAKLSEFKQGSPMEQQIIKQIMDKMELNTEKAKSEVALKLNPEYLGEVRLNMTVDKDKGTVSVNFKTGSKTAKKALEGNIKSLEEAFSAAGLKLDKFEVSIDDQLA
ncbi:MAG: flagellar hook-length control protein FliK [Candidatus Eremiobacterota bacterium]